MTFLLEIVRLGITNLRLHLLRSFLTALGIILGVGAVITMVAIGEGSKQEALMQIERLGAKNIILRSQKPPESNMQTGGQQQSFVVTYGLTRDDLDVIRTNFQRRGDRAHQGIRQPADQRQPRADQPVVRRDARVARRGGCGWTVVATSPRATSTRRA